MNYVDANLMPNEQIIAHGYVHWWIYAQGAIVSLTGLILFVWTDFFGAVTLFIGLILLTKAWIHAFSTELVITNRRVIAKFGFIRRNTVELLHKSVESFHVEQSIMGRLLDFGTVIINGTGGVRTPIPGIAAPLDFRRQALNTIDNNTA